MRIWACLLILALGGYAFASEPAGDNLSLAELQQTFLRAGQAYDENRVADAIAIFERLAGQGYVSAELFFNLGNNYFRNGQPGLAALNYRRAWQLSPRDPDIAANLSFTLDTTGAVLPSPALPIRVLEELSFREWVVVATACYWIAALAFCLQLAVPRGHALFRRLLAAAALLLALSLAGIGHWRTLRSRPEVVVTRPGQKALFAPLEKSTAHFELPEGSIVRAVKAADAWLEVSADGKAGWIRGDACRPVSAWQAR